VSTFDDAVSDNQLFLQKTARHYAIKYGFLRDEEVQQIILIGFWEAWKKHTQTGGATLATYARTVIGFRFIDYIRDEVQWSKRRQEKAIVCPLPEDYEVATDDSLGDLSFLDYGTTEETTTDVPLGSKGCFELGRLVEGVFVSTGERTDDIEEMGPRLNYLNDRAWNVVYVVKRN